MFPVFFEDSLSCLQGGPPLEYDKAQLNVIHTFTGFRGPPYSILYSLGHLALCVFWIWSTGVTFYLSLPYFARVILAQETIAHPTITLTAFFRPQSNYSAARGHANTPSSCWECRRDNSYQFGFICWGTVSPDIIFHHTLFKMLRSDAKLFGTHPSKARDGYRRRFSQKMFQIPPLQICVASYGLVWVRAATSLRISTSNVSFLFSLLLIRNNN